MKKTGRSTCINMLRLGVAVPTPADFILAERQNYLGSHKLFIWFVYLEKYAVSIHRFLMQAVQLQFQPVLRKITLKQYVKHLSFSMISTPCMNLD